MVYLITGPIASGKSARLKSLYKHLDSGDGFINRRIYNYNIYMGQEIIQLSTGRGILFSCVRNQTPAGWDEICTFQDYSFSQQGLAFAGKIISEIIDKGITAFIDEIGPLELMGKGLHDAFLTILESKNDIYAVTRDTCFRDCIRKFNIREYKVIPVL